MNTEKLQEKIQGIIKTYSTGRAAGKIAGIVVGHLEELQEDMASAEFRNGNYTEEMHEYISNWIKSIE